LDHGGRRRKTWGSGAFGKKCYVREREHESGGVRRKETKCRKRKGERPMKRRRRRCVNQRGVPCTSVNQSKKKDLQPRVQADRARTVEFRRPKREGSYSRGREQELKRVK